MLAALVALYYAIFFLIGALAGFAFMRGADI